MPRQLPRISDPDHHDRVCVEHSKRNEDYWVDWLYMVERPVGKDQEYIEANKYLTEQLKTIMPVASP